MITIDFAAKPIVLDGNVGDKLKIPGQDDIIVVGTDTAFALLKVYYFEKDIEFRYATEEEVKQFRIKKLSELTGIDVDSITRSTAKIEVEQPKGPAKKTEKKSTSSKTDEESKKRTTKNSSKKEESK